MMNYPENGPYHISETVEARHFKYGLQIDRDEQNQVISERAWIQDHVTFLMFRIYKW